MGGRSGPSRCQHASLPIKSLHSKYSHYVTPRGPWDASYPVTGGECGMSHGRSEKKAVVLTALLQLYCWMQSALEPGWCVSANRHQMQNSRLFTVSAKLKWGATGSVRSVGAHWKTVKFKSAVWHRLSGLLKTVIIIEEEQKGASAIK